MAENEVSTKLKITPCGDGLYFFGGDLFCTYKLLSTEINETSVKYEYEPYTVTVSWTKSGDNKKTDPKWKREYK